MRSSIRLLRSWPICVAELMEWKNSGVTILKRLADEREQVTNVIGQFLGIRATLTANYKSTGMECSQCKTVIYGKFDSIRTIYLRLSRN